MGPGGVHGSTPEFIRKGSNLLPRATQELSTIPPRESKPAPLVADIFCGPTAPITKAFLFCGWHSIPIDWELDPSHDLSNPLRQQSLSEQLQEADCIMAAFDCSTKSRAREIPRSFSDGRPAPKPLRSNDYPLGLPTLQGEQKDRVETDNAACAFILDEIQALRDRGGIAIRSMA